MRRGDDGFFQSTFVSTYKFPVPAGLVLGNKVPILGEARDVVGFLGIKDSFVTVRGP